MPLDPARIIFAAKPKRVNRFDEEDDGCQGCLFLREHSSVCHKAEEEALKRGLPSCENDHIYIAVKIDPRQVDMFE
jgi:hypothetical protein